ncbi:MAG: nucleotide sugar dehydrogenase [Anaerolineae bacterium]
MRNITVIGVGYVGLVTGTCFSDLGNRVTAVDISEKRIESLKQGIMPIYEPGLKEVVERNVKAERLRFTTDYVDALRDAEFVFICVGTPEGVDGEADLQYVRMAAESIAKTMDHPLIVINKSTVPVGTGDWVANIIRENQPKPIPFSVVSCPEFLREGSAVRDFFNPDRTVLGSTDRDAASQVAQLHLPLRAPIMITDLRTAEMIKYASNAFLATRISFINEIANICETLGADVKEVAQGMGYDKRIGHHFLESGVGYGGSCFTADETIFTLNSPNIGAETVEEMFRLAGEAFKGDLVELKVPKGKRVLSFDLDAGKPVLAEVKALTRRPYKGNMVTLIASMGRTLRVTADHPIVIRTTTGFETIPAADVAPGDQVMILTSLPDTVDVPTELNLTELLRGKPLGEDTYVTAANGEFRAQYETFAKHVPSDMLAYPHDIKRYNRMSLSLYWYLTDKGVLNVPAQALQLYTAKAAATRINAVIPVDGDLLRLCGYYIAEGFISLDKGRADATRERVGFSFHEAEVEYISDLHRILERYGLKFILCNSTHATTTTVSSRVFAWLMRDILKCGTNSNNKALPRIAFNVPAALRYELVRGAFSGDGAVTPVQEGKNLMLEYATTSKQLANGMTLLLQTMGIIPSIRTQMMNKSKHLAHILRVSGYSQLDTLKDALGEKHRGQIESILAGYKRQIKQRGFDHQGDYALLNIMAVDYEPVETDVYSLETETGMVVLASGMVQHNCFPKDVKALSYMAQIHGTNPKMLQAVMEINQTQRKQIVIKLEDLLHEVKGKTIAMLGLAFKENTDDIRVSPSLEIAEMLHDMGAIIRGYDPEANDNVARSYPFIHLCKDAYELAEGADAIVVATPWNEFKGLDMARIKAAMKQAIMVDGRNLYDGERMKQLGFVYRGVGRGYNGALDKEKTEAKQQS